MLLDFIYNTASHRNAAGAADNRRYQSRIIKRLSEFEQEHLKGWTLKCAQWKDRNTQRLRCGRGRVCGSQDPGVIHVAGCAHLKGVGGREAGEARSWKDRAMGSAGVSNDRRHVAEEGEISIGCIGQGKYRMTSLFSPFAILTAPPPRGHSIHFPGAASRRV